MNSEKQGHEPPPNYNEAVYPPQPAFYQPPTDSNPPQRGYGFPQQQNGGFGQQPGASYSQYGQQNQSVIVTQPMAGNVVMAAPRPPDYTIPSIIVCLCCFWPTGLFAIYFSMQTTKLSRNGDMAGAQQTSNNAKNCMIASFIVGACWIVAVIVVRIVLTSVYYS